jgi:outer membrane protein assembly factor BamA
MLSRVRQFGFCALAVATVLIPGIAQEPEPTSRAQEIQQAREEKAKIVEPETPGAIERQFIKFQGLEFVQRFGQPSNGVFPRLGGLASGQGTGLGLQYSKTDAAGGRIKLTGFAVASLSKSQRYGLDITAPYIANRRAAWNLSASRRTLTKVGFYGLGPDSKKEDRSVFLLEDTSLDTSFTFKPSGERFQFGVNGGYLQTNTGTGSGEDLPSIEERFSASVIPGLADQGNFIRVGGFATLDLRDNPALTRTGTLLRADFTNYQDQDLGHHDFNRMEFEAQHYIPFFNKRRVIALRARTVMNVTADDQSVPFYLKPWIGGPQELRGFRTYRFYDDNVLVMNAEYRWEAFSGLDMALFMDAGQAVARRQDFNIGKMETAAGIGFRFNVRNATFLRLDVAFSNEETRIWFRWGDPF